MYYCSMSRKETMVTGELLLRKQSKVDFPIEGHVNQNSVPFH